MIKEYLTIVSLTDPARAKFTTPFYPLQIAFNFTAVLALNLNLHLLISDEAGHILATASYPTSFIPFKTPTTIAAAAVLLILTRGREVVFRYLPYSFPKP